MTCRAPVGVRIAALAVCLCGFARPAADYPLTLSLEAKAKTAAAQVISSVSVHVDRLMEESRRKRVTDALTYSGYSNFLTTLRSLPPVGVISLQERKVNVRYAREQNDASGQRRLILVADRPLFFLSGDPTKARVGYELTVVDLRFDAQGGVTGTMAGAARVKPSPEGIVLDDYAQAPVELTGHLKP